MIYKESESNTQVVGNIVSNKVSIQERDSDFILTILSSNLYSNPIGSLIREYASNAVDSHKEAGVDDPVIITLGKEMSSGRYFFSVKDFGTGLSPERFNDVFLNLASSTKRQSNEYIGMWGLGRLSGLSYTDQIQITSNYNGESTQYLMYKDGNQINIDKIITLPTTERNGVEIRLQVNEPDLNKFAEEIVNQLKFFENIYLSLENVKTYSSTMELNSSKIKRFNKFAVCSIDKHYSYSRESFYILLGNVVYPLEKRYFYDKSSDEECYYEGIYPIFEIGELEITPNRESILYSNKNIEKIKSRIIEAKEEYFEMFKESFKKDSKYLGELFQSVKPIIPIESEPEYKLRVFTFKHWTYRGKPIGSYKDYDDMIHALRGDAYEKIRANYIFENRKLSSTTKKFTLFEVLLKIPEDKVFIVNLNEMNTRQRAYFKSMKFKDDTIFIGVAPNVEETSKYHYYSLTSEEEDKVKEEFELIKCLNSIEVPEDFDHRVVEKPKDDYFLSYKIIKDGKRGDSIVKESVTIKHEDSLERYLTSDKVYIYGNESDSSNLIDLYRNIREHNVKFIILPKNHNITLSNVIYYKDFLAQESEIMDKIYIRYKLKELDLTVSIMGGSGTTLKKYNETLYNKFIHYYGIEYSYEASNYTLMVEALKNYKSKGKFIKEFEKDKETWLKYLYIIKLFTEGSRSLYRDIPANILNVLTDYLERLNFFPIKEGMIKKLREETIFNNTKN